MALIFFSGLLHAKGPGLTSDWTLVQKRLHKAGCGAAFVKSLRTSYSPADFSQVLELNTLLFLRKSDYHGPQVTDDAVKDVREFIAKNRLSLLGAEKMYGVPPEVVASLLWLESRYGDNQGRFHVPSVFVDLVQADRPAALRHLYTAAKAYTPHVTAKIRRAIRQRAKRKVQWALAELKALEIMRKKDRSVIKDLHGSFAGAFGMAQFEPSSFVHYAKSSARKRRTPDLNRADDAIYSVAYYLKANGWRKGRRKTYARSLMKYNKSRDYGRAILNLARRASPSLRLPASKPKSKSKKSRRAANKINGYYKAEILG